jgi:hypothetical protein
MTGVEVHDSLESFGLLPPHNSENVASVLPSAVQAAAGAVAVAPFYSLDCLVHVIVWFLAPPLLHFKFSFECLFVARCPFTVCAAE